MELSLVIPVYNGEKYIEECIRSVLTSEVDKSKIEIVIIDDGSTDNSVSICNKYTSENFKVYCNSNHGVSYSRNFGVNVSNGKWIMFIDADDKLSYNWYSIVSKYFNSNEDIVTFSNKVEKIPDEKVEILKNIVGINNDVKNLASPCSKMYRKNFLQDNKITFYQDIINGEDMLFNINCFLNTQKYKFVEDNIYEYRIHNNSATRKFNDSFIQYDLNFQNRLAEILNCSELSNEQKSIIISFCKKNSLIIIAQRMCYGGKYTLFKKNKYIFDEYFRTCRSKVNLGIKKESIIFLLRIKCYFGVYLILSLIKKMKKDNKTSYFVNI